MTPGTGENQPIRRGRPQFTRTKHDVPTEPAAQTSKHERGDVWSGKASVTSSALLARSHSNLEHIVATSDAERTEWDGRRSLTGGQDDQLGVLRRKHHREAHERTSS